MRRRTKSEILQDDFLELRKTILDLAAQLDRFDTAADDGKTKADPRLGQIREALTALTETDRPRAETVQRIFSLAYDADWMKTLGVGRRF
jgi:hypothetical protein